ncbi:hypothetical protein Tco_0973517 [Tanacetum coccineum]
MGIKRGGGQNLQMKFCFSSSQFFACLGDVLSNHLLASPISVRGNTCKRAESSMLNRLATSSTFLICSIAFSVEHPEKILIRMTQIHKSIDVVDWSRQSVSSSPKLSFRIGERSGHPGVTTSSSHK